MTRLVTPPQLNPIRNSRNASTNRADARGGPVLGEDDGEDAAGAGEVALPQVVAGTVGEGGVQHCPRPRGRLFSQPATVSVAPLEPRRGARRASAGRAARGRSRRARPPCREALRASDPLVARRRRDRHGAEEQIAVAADVLRERLDADVDAVGERIEQDAGGVGVVERDRHAVRVRGGDDRRHVLDLHRHRAGTLAPDQRRVRPDLRGDAVADQRVVGLDLDGQAGEELACHFESSGRTRCRARGRASRPGSRRSRPAPAPLDRRVTTKLCRAPSSSATLSPSSSAVGVP